MTQTSENTYINTAGVSTNPATEGTLQAVLSQLKTGGTGGTETTSVAPPTTFAGGTKTTTTSEALVASTACQYVWIGARVSDLGVAQNSGVVFIGDSTGQNIPIMPSNFEGMIIHIDNASKIYIKAITSGDGVAYRIFV